MFRDICSVNLLTYWVRLQVVIHVDEEFTRSGTTVGEFTMLASKRLYVAGSPEPGELLGAKVKDNFRGCMRKVSHVPLGVITNMDKANLFFEAKIQCKITVP